GKDSQPFPKCAPVHDEKSDTDRVFDDLLRGGIPIQSLSGPIGLGGHDAHDRMREAVIDISVRLLAIAHGIEPMHQVNHVVIAGTAGIRFSSIGHTENLSLILRWSHPWRRSVTRVCVVLGIEVLPSAFLRDQEERSPLATIVLDTSVTSLNTAETSIAVSERGRVRV